MIKLKESCLFKALALFCGCLWWPPCETPPRRLSGKGWAPSFLLHRVEAYPNSLFPSKKCSSLNPLSFNFDSYGLCISSLQVKMFGVKKLLLSHFPWPICICTRHFAMEFHIVKAWCLQGKFQFSIMGQFNIKCHFLPKYWLQEEGLYHPLDFCISAHMTQPWEGCIPQVRSSHSN